MPDVLACRACGTRLTAEVTRVVEPPPRTFADEEQIGYHPTMPPGTWAIDPEPVMRHLPDGTPADTPGALVLHPDDAADLESHPDRGRNSGCCGLDGCDGPNLRCPSCHAEVATLRNDCWTVVELRFEPAAVRVEPAT